MTRNLAPSGASTLSLPEPRTAPMSNEIHAAPIRFIKLREVIDRVSLSSTEIYRQMEDGRFPRPIRLTQARIAWVESDVVAWQEGILAARSSRGREKIIVVLARSRRV